jgi:hypothetical protein
MASLTVSLRTLNYWLYNAYLPGKLVSTYSKSGSFFNVAIRVGFTVINMSTKQSKSTNPPIYPATTPHSLSQPYVCKEDSFPHLSSSAMRFSARLSLHHTVTDLDQNSKRRAVLLCQAKDLEEKFRNDADHSAVEHQSGT